MKRAFHENPLSIVGPLFALTITFWAANVVRYINEEAEDAESFFKDQVGFLEPSENGPSASGEDAAPVLSETGTSDSPKDGESVPTKKDRRNAWRAEQANRRAAVSLHLLKDPLFHLTMISAVLFLMDLLCVLWWYARYIYVIQPMSTFVTHFVDFIVCGMFATAANAWQLPYVFCAATVVGSVLLGARLRMIYHDGNANDTDRRIIRSAWRGLGLAIVMPAIIMPILIIKDMPILGVSSQEIGLRILPGVLSAIGIYLTVKFRESISISSDIHECGQRRFVPMDIFWPKDTGRETRERIRTQTCAGLKSFREIFEGSGPRLAHERLRSRVHAEGDLRVQSYVLAIPSQGQQDADEITAKSRLVALSHWLDDLMDGRQDKWILDAFRNRSSGTAFDFGVENGALRPGYQGELFKKLYMSDIVKYTDSVVYGRTEKLINAAVPNKANLDFMYFGLNRVAAGAAMFSPKVRPEERMDFRIKHNLALRNLVNGTGPWRRAVSGLLEEMDQSDGPGHYLLSLTTKTAQEIAMSSERKNLNFPLSVLYSLLFAPLLYFHDVEGEMEHGEMIALDNFCLDYAQVIPWLERLKVLCQDAEAEDERFEFRLQQLEMAFQCFSPRLPSTVREALAGIYISDDTPPPSAEEPGPRFHVVGEGEVTHA